MASASIPTRNAFDRRLKAVRSAHERLLSRLNRPEPQPDNGIFTRFRHPVLTAGHVPLEWRYDLDRRRNPLLMERLGVNAVFNPGAFFWKNRVHLVVRVEGSDRKSFFAIAESKDGLSDFRFWDEPCDIPEIEPETNLYDMRITFHDDGWIYGVFCTESRDPKAPFGDLSSAVAAAGIVRTRDFRRWERLPNLTTPSSQQRNVVLHPEFVDGCYGFYTRPMDGFIDVGGGGGIGWTLCEDITAPRTGDERIIDERAYHTIKESKNGLGPAPLKTPRGWLHLAHGVRTCASGLRYVLYLFMTSLDDPSRVIARPGGYLLAPAGAERVGDVSNVVFSNGWVRLPDDTVLLYYASSDTRCHVARTTVERLLDYCYNTPPDGENSRGSLEQRLALIAANRATGRRIARGRG